MVENLEPVTWAEELIEPARVLDHPRLVSLCGTASMCFMLGRVDEALAYSNTGQIAMRPSPDEVRFGVLELWLGAVYSSIGEPERYVAFYRNQLLRGHDTHELWRVSLVVALALVGRFEDALSVATGLISAAEATHNPYVLSFALFADGLAWRTEDPLRALDSLRRGLAIAQESGNRANETYLAMTLAMTLGRIEAEPGDPLVSLDNITLAIRHYHDAGNTQSIRGALGVLAVFLDRHGRSESAAIIAGFARVSPSRVGGTRVWHLITHLREVLGDQTYESLARKGETMTTAEMATYAYDQIDQARAELNAVSE